MPTNSSDPTPDLQQRLRALARWENEGGKTSPIGPVAAGTTAHQPTPAMTDAEIVALRVRVIALENALIALLAAVPEHQLDLVRELAEHILPRPGFTPHPLTIHAARHMLDLVARSRCFRPTSDEDPSP